MNLVELGQGVFAFVDPSTGFGHSNAGLVIDADGLTVIDTTATTKSGMALHRSVLDLTAELDLPIKRIVLSSSRIAYSGGSQPFWASAFYGSEATSEQLDAPANPDAFRRLLPEFSFAYPDEFTTRPITHTVGEPAWLSAAALGTPAVGESPANLIVSVESAQVVFAGALASFGVTPLVLNGYPEAWIESLQRLAEAGSTIIPGHGPPGGPADLVDLIGYLQACIDADGQVEQIDAGPWDEWTDRRFDPVNVERAAALAQGIDDMPRSMFTLLGLD